MANKFINRPGTGVLKHSQNRKTEKSPDMYGELVLDKDYSAGSVLELAGWKKTTPQNYLISLKISTRESERQWPKQVGSIDDSEVPF